MQSDLISRSALIEKLIKENVPYNPHINEIICNMPCAYDVKKVVAELEEDERHTFDGCINKRYAIEKIRNGGKE